MYVRIYLCTCVSMCLYLGIYVHIHLLREVVGPGWFGSCGFSVHSSLGFGSRFNTTQRLQCQPALPYVPPWGSPASCAFWAAAIRFRLRFGPFVHVDQILEHHELW